jgi:hypothetical protein
MWDRHVEESFIRLNLLPQLRISLIKMFVFKHEDSKKLVIIVLTFASKNEILAPQYSNVLQAVLSTFLCNVTIAFLYGTHILLVDVSV